MHPAASDFSSPKPLTQPANDASRPPASGADNLYPAQRHNFIVMVIYQVVMRMGWIFKTESVIMPAVLDSIGGAGWLRGCLPMLNRFSQSIPPLVLARQIKIMPRKK